MLASTLENLLINGDFLPGLWNRLSNPADGVPCELWRQTFAADRWKVRYGCAEGAGITQHQSADTPRDSAAPRSLELRGSTGVCGSIFIGQRIESIEAPRYRSRLVFSTWLRIDGCNESYTDIGLTVGTPRMADQFGGAFNDGVEAVLTDCFKRVPTGRWIHVECTIDARNLSSTGLSLEIELPASILNSASARFGMTGARLADIAVAGRTVARPSSVESVLARRYFQRFDSGNLNSLGRPLVVNPHELHFQLTFPEMRAFPSCTLPHSENGFRVFDIEGFPQSGFAYDVTYRSRGSAIIRATKENHQVRDGYLSFVDASAAILLEAEL